MDKSAQLASRSSRVVIVTGASRGLGLATAELLAQNGYCVVCIARKPNADFEAVVAKLNGGETATAGIAGSLHFIAADLGQIDELPQLARRIRKEFGPIHGLVNNAAIGTEGLLATMPNRQIEDLVRLNTLSPIVLTKYVARSMMADGGGRIVNMSSIIGFTGYNALSVYAATKASMLGFTRSLAREVGGMGVTVNAVAPGFIETEMTGSLDAQQKGRVARRAALRRLAEPKDVANAVLYLLGDGARNVTGTVMTVDAGSTA